MKPAEYISYDGLGLAELIRNREISHEEALECAVMKRFRQAGLRTIGRAAAPWPLNAPLLKLE